MTGNMGLLMVVSAGFFILALGIFAIIGLLIYWILEMRKASSTLFNSLQKVDERLGPVLTETEKCLRSMRRVTDDIGAVTDTARNFAEAGNDIVINLRELSDLVRDIRSGASLRVFGIKKGLKAAVSVLVNEIKRRR